MHFQGNCTKTRRKQPVRRKNRCSLPTPSQRIHKKKMQMSAGHGVFSTSFRASRNPAGPRAHEETAFFNVIPAQAGIQWASGPLLSRETGDGGHKRPVSRRPFMRGALSAIALGCARGCARVVSRREIRLNGACAKGHMRRDTTGARWRRGLFRPADTGHAPVIEAEDLGFVLGRIRRGS